MSEIDEVSDLQGYGVESNPYLIQSAEEFPLIKQNMEAHYVIYNDLDFGRLDDYQPIGNRGEGFAGTLDGNGNTIKNLSIKRLHTMIGLFGVIGEAGEVSDLTIDNCEVVGGDYVGALAGHNKGDIKNVEVSGEVHTNEPWNVCGGLVGSNSGFIVEVATSGKVSGDNIVGGVAGKNGSTILYSSSWAVVSGSTTVGGFVGKNNKTIEECRSYNLVSGVDNVGGFVGVNNGKIKGGSVTDAEVRAGGGKMGWFAGLNEEDGTIAGEDKDCGISHYPSIGVDNGASIIE